MNVSLKTREIKAFSAQNLVTTTQDATVFFTAVTDAINKYRNTKEAIGFQKKNNIYSFAHFQYTFSMEN